MARQTKENAEKTRISIIYAALKLFHCKGYVSTTLNQIAEEAGVTRGAVYWHFDDKVKIFEAIEDEVYRKIDVDFMTLLTKPINSLDEIKQMIINYLQYFEKDQDFKRYYEMVHFKMEWNEEFDYLFKKEQAFYNTMIKVLKKSFVKLQKKGIIRPELKPETTIVMVGALVAGLIETWLFAPGSFSLTNDLPSMLDTFFYGIKL